MTAGTASLPRFCSGMATRTAAPGGPNYSVTAGEHGEPAEGEPHIYICTAPRGSNRHTLCKASHGSRPVESYGGFLTRRMRFFRAPASPEANERKSEIADNEVSTCGDGADGKRKTAVFDAIWHKTAGFFHRKLPMERQTHGMERPFHPVRFAKHPFGGGKKGPVGARALLKGGQRQPSALTL